MNKLEKYNNQIAAGIQLLICGTALILAIRRELSGDKRSSKRAAKRGR